MNIQSKGLFQKKKKTRQLIDQEIYNIGAVLLESELMNRAKTQRHHMSTTLYDHTMEVSRKSVMLCNKLEKRGKHVDRKNVIIGALCHDLAMVGRDEKYISGKEACKRHPIESAEIARDFFPDINDETVRTIERHMWPLTPDPPVSLEDWVVSQADKEASVKCFITEGGKKSFYKGKHILLNTAEKFSPFVSSFMQAKNEY